MDDTTSNANNKVEGSIGPMTRDASDNFRFAVRGGKPLLEFEAIIEDSFPNKVERDELTIDFNLVNISGTSYADWVLGR